MSKSSSNSSRSSKSSSRAMSNNSSRRAKQFGTIKTDEDGVPYGSGNYKSWQSKYGSIGTPLNFRYCQFRIYAKKI